MIRGINSRIFVRFTTPQKTDNTEVSNEENATKNTLKTDVPESKAAVSSSEALNKLEGKQSSSTEKFRDVFDEMSRNVPDSTSTVAEKKLAIQYIDRMLACDDIPADMKSYWTDKKKVIQYEIDHFYDGNKKESFKDVFAEMDKNVPDQTTNVPQKELALKYIDRMLACDDIPDDMKSYWTDKKKVIQYEIDHFYDGNKKESFKDVFAEMDKNVPDSTTNVPQKELAIKYINRMLACDDIPDDMKAYWTDKKQAIQYEIDHFYDNSNDKTGNDSQFMQILNEMRENVPDRTSTYEEKTLALEYIDRMLACDDIPDEAKIFWTNQMAVIEDERSHCLPQKAEALAKEWKKFVGANWKGGDFPNAKRAIAYYDKYIDYMNKILECENLPQEWYQIYESMRQGAMTDLNNWKREQFSH